jgi:hypothetical protein
MYLTMTSIARPVVPAPVGAPVITFSSVLAAPGAPVCVPRRNLSAFTRATLAAMTLVVGLVWTGVARADDAVRGMVPELVCTSAARPLEQGVGAVQVCSVVWVRPHGK